MAEVTKKNLTGVILAISIILIIGAAVSIALDVPLSKSFSLPSVPASGPAHQVNITLYADALGWDYSKGKTNPTIVIPPGTLVHFTVIEEDNQPHTLTVAPGAKETSTSATLLSKADITTTPGHESHASAYFPTTGEYTYWCIVHPTTMVGQLYVNASASLQNNNTSTQHNYLHYSNQTMNLNHSALQANGKSYPSLYIQKDTFLNVTVKANSSSATRYSLNFSYGSALNLSNSTTMIAATNATASGGFYFTDPGVYTYWNYYNRSMSGSIYVYNKTMSLTLYADFNGWNYSKGAVNPSFTFSQFTLVNLTVVNLDNLTHSLILNPGNNENSSYSSIANLTPGVNSTSVMLFFGTAGNYTYWDSYHPSTAVGSITVQGQNSTAGGNMILPGSLYNGNSDISVYNTQTSHSVNVRVEN